MNNHTRPKLLCLALLLSTFALPVQAQTPDLKAVIEQLNSLKAEVGAIRAENTALRQQLGYDAKGKATAAVALVQGKEAKLSIGGFVQVQGEAGDAPDARFPTTDRFLIRRARLGVKGSFAENFDFTLQTDLGNNSLNSTSGYRAQLTDAFIVWNKYSFANLTAGQFKMPYGYDQLLADTKTLTIERTLPNDQLTLPRQAGAMVAGSFFGKKLGYAAALVNGNGNNNSANDNEQFTSVGRVYATAFDRQGVKVNVGINGFAGYDTGTFTGHRTGNGVDAQFYYAGAEIDAEVLRTHFNRDVGVDYNGEGWSLAGSYFFVPNKWQGVVRYESYDPSTVTGGDKTTLRTIGINYLIKGDDLKLMLNYLIGNPPGSAKHQDRLVARMLIIF
jgi:phosphate-selective porin